MTKRSPVCQDEKNTQGSVREREKHINKILLELWLLWRALLLLGGNLSSVLSKHSLKSPPKLEKSLGNYMHFCQNNLRKSYFVSRKRITAIYSIYSFFFLCHS